MITWPCEAANGCKWDQLLSPWNAVMWLWGEGQPSELWNRMISTLEGSIVFEQSLSGQSQVEDYLYCQKGCADVYFKRGDASSCDGISFGCLFSKSLFLVNLLYQRSLISYIREKVLRDINLLSPYFWKIFEVVERLFFFLFIPLPNIWKHTVAHIWTHRKQMAL